MRFRLSAGGVHEFNLSYPDGSVIPEKLGDGNFGIVFKGTDSAGPVAVKFIYLRQATNQAGSTVDADYKLTRILDELEVTIKISEVLNQKARNSQAAKNLLNSFSDHLVLPKSFCEDLKDDQVFLNKDDEKIEFYKAKEALEERDIYLSQYAYAMDQFDCSLKDLVEGNVRIEDGSYHKLEDTPMLERERSALFVMQGVGRGLKVLHLADLRHQDIKPANIYYKADDTNVDFRLGDLGFLRPQSPVEAGSGMVPSHALAIGTKHYRSIEQIDFSDTSEVKVELAKDKYSATLTSHDPKFLRTNIAPGDLVYFPKSNAQRLFVIKSMQRNEKDHTTEIVVDVPSPPEKVEDQEGLGVIFDDENTQVSFVKNPTAKTDLFGLGGILFDIISAGDSPERLYDLLRKFDVPGSSIADQIVSYYSIWQADQFVDPAVSAIFQRVKGTSSESVSEVTLTFLLRCCMSEPQDSFYNEFGFADKNKEELAWDRILDEITKLVDYLNASTYSRIKVNCLTGKSKEIEVSRQEPRLLLNYLPMLTNSVASTPDGQSVTSSDENRVFDHSERCLRGLTLVEKISERICFLSKKSISGEVEKEFISFAPEHLSFDKDFFSLSHNDLFGSLPQEEYYRKLINLDTTLCSLSPYQDRFLPVWWRDRSRRIEIKEQANSGSTMSLKVGYSDFLPSWPGIEPGDYIVVLGAGRANSLLIVEKLRSKIELEVRKHIEPSDQEDEVHLGVRSKGYIIKKLNPVDYLAGMHGVYIFHALLLGLGPDEVLDPGGKVGAFIARGDVPALKPPSEQYVAKSKFFPMSRKKYDIATYTHQLYLWLSSRAYWNLELDDIDTVSKIQDEVTDWLKYCSETLGGENVLSNVPLNLSDAIPDKVMELNLSELNSLKMTQSSWDKLSSSVS